LHLQSFQLVFNNRLVAAAAAAVVVQCSSDDINSDIYSVVVAYSASALKNSLKRLVHEMFNISIACQVCRIKNICTKILMKRPAI